MTGLTSSARPGANGIIRGGLHNPKTKSTMPQATAFRSLGRIQRLYLIRIWGRDGGEWEGPGCQDANPLASEAPNPEP
ncbi:hypothetical protein ACRE_062940 [Hapsidospora chrysogenum ATCC 11550]|uniref:Uncharacterized protein n=1 Tax=Hapsidospora chrysogenum (strain ATCC 11550 / CBS 779.69 / DSM 880 / IAM 14645 / JCM 23072 / IMI 49137) TaxID=857340 RepID=A0A086T0T7_HAPC1|nr:hypothetical protein ACRE_062940 [Hapsidospora chrysogenum ATCC 11550]